MSQSNVYLAQIEYTLFDVFYILYSFMLKQTSFIEWMNYLNHKIYLCLQFY